MTILCEGAKGTLETRQPTSPVVPDIFAKESLSLSTLKTKQFEGDSKKYKFPYKQKKVLGEFLERKGADTMLDGKVVQSQKEKRGHAKSVGKRYINAHWYRRSPSVDRL